MKRVAPRLVSASTVALWATIAVAPALGRSAVAAEPAPGDRPTSGATVAGFEGVDKAVGDSMTRVRATAATAAVYDGGRLVYARGFGWRDEGRTVPTAPDDLMRIASVTKPVTASIVRGLAREGKLSLDDRAFVTLGVVPPPPASRPAGTLATPAADGAARAAGTVPGRAVDPRLADVTVRHLLSHQGGWDRALAGDPMFRIRQIEFALDVSGPARPADVVRFMAGQPLQFAPGERSAYSNFGYCVLGRVIERATGQPYADVLRERVCEPLGIAADLKVGHARAADRDRREVWYPVPDDAFSLDVMDSHGALIASAPALGRFMQAYWVSGEPRPAGAKGYQYAFFGSLPGTTAMVLQRPDGRDVAVLLNARRNRNYEADDAALRATVTAALDAIPPGKPTPAP